MPRGGKARVGLAKLARHYAPAVRDDLAVLAAVHPDLVAAALAAVEDLAYGRQRGKQLGRRHVTGDLTGLARLRFDLPGLCPARFRIVYRLVEDRSAVEILAIGKRLDHVVYRDTLTRLDPTADDPPGGRPDLP